MKWCVWCYLPTRNSEFIRNVFPMKACTPFTFPATLATPINNSLDDNNVNVVPRCYGRHRTKSSFGFDFVFLTKNGDRLSR